MCGGEGPGGSTGVGTGGASGSGAQGPVGTGSGSGGNGTGTGSGSGSGRNAQELESMLQEHQVLEECVLFMVFGAVAGVVVRMVGDWPAVSRQMQWHVNRCFSRAFVCERGNDCCMLTARSNPTASTPSCFSIQPFPVQVKCWELTLGEQLNITRNESHF